MGARRLALIVATSLGMPTAAFAQGAEGEIEMGEEEAAPAPDAPPADQPPAEPQVVKDPKVAKKWLQAATTLMTKGDQLTKKGNAAEAKTSYDNAVVAYTKALEASDDVTIHLHLANALDKSGDSVTAMTHLKTLLAAQGVKPDVMKKAQTKLDELSMKVGVVTLSITPEGTAVTLAGKQIGEAPLTEPLVLMPGNHVVSFAAVGYQPKDVELKIEAGSESERKIELEPVPIVTKPDIIEPEPTPIVAAPTPSKLPIFIGGGATVGLLVLGTVTGIITLGKQGDYDDSVSPTERSDLRSSGKTMALVTDLALVGAVGAAAFTTYWYMYKYRPQAKALSDREQQARGPKVDVVPWVQADAGGITAVGSF